jgi:hypothetical protein
VLSLADYIIEADLQTAIARKRSTIQPKRKRTQKAGGEPSSMRGQQKYQTRDEDVIGAADSEMGEQEEAG